MSKPKVEINLTHENDENEDICELEHLRKLFIGGLAPYTTEESLKDFYGQFGKIVDVVVMRDPASKRSRGFGFVTFTRSAMVDKAQDNRPHIIDGKTVEAKRALPRPERESRESSLSVKKLFVGGLKDNHDEKCLEDYFAQFGHVVSVKILTDKTTGKRRGFAFIEFDDYDSVDKAILQKTHSIKFVLVDVKKSVYQENRSNTNNNVNAVKQDQSIKKPNNYRNGNQMQPPQQMGQYSQQQQQQQQQMNGAAAQQAAPPNYNYWGPQPPAMQAPPYAGYPPAQQPSWNYPPTGGQPWNAGPPPQQNNWYPPQQWAGPAAPGGAQPPLGTVPPNAPPPVPPTNWSGPPQVPPVQPAPVSAPVGVPPAAQGAVPQQQQPPQTPRPNFGSGYQQGYGGGPAKNNMHQNRMNPYNSSGGNNYVTNGQGSNGNNVPITAGGNTNKFRR